MEIHNALNLENHNAIESIEFMNLDSFRLRQSETKTVTNTVK